MREWTRTCRQYKHDWGLVVGSSTSNVTVRLLHIIAAVVVAGLLALGGFATMFYLTAMKIEYRSQATWLMIEVMRQYVTQSHGKWPDSWDELAASGVEAEFGRYSWPGDIDTIREHVRIDFSTSAEAVAAAESSLPDAIQPRGGSFVYSSDYLLLYATVCVEAGPPEQAIDELTNILSQRKFAEYYRLRGTAYLRHGQKDKAERDFERAEQLEKRSY